MKAKYSHLSSRKILALTLAVLGAVPACSEAPTGFPDAGDGSGAAAPSAGGTDPGAGGTTPGGGNGSGGVQNPNVGGGAPAGGSASGGGFPGTGGFGLGPGAGGAIGSGGGGDPGGTGGASPGTGGGGPLGPGLTDLGGFTSATCAITPTITNATKIPTVGIATFTADLPGADRAIIQFGTSTEYSLEAPVDWAADSHRTLILGTPANTDIHYRIAVFAGNNVCVTADATYKSGPLPNGGPANATVTKGSSSVAPAPGFMIAGSGITGDWAWITDKQGKVVWAYQFQSTGGGQAGTIRAHMSWDGKYMYKRDLGPFNAASGGTIRRVGMDGEGEASVQVTGGNHHDFTVTPTGIAYISKQAAGQCDRIFTAGPDGSGAKSIVDLDTVFGKFGQAMGTGEKCHVNAIHYYSDRDAFSVSDREKDAIAIFSATGEYIASAGKQPDQAIAGHALAQGAGTDWRVQHGHDWYAENKLVLWSNGSFGAGTSKVLHYTINGSSATLDWSYTMAGNSPTLGDAQLLPNGNFLMTCSQLSNVHEIDPNRQLIQTMKGSGGYTTHRTTLYGPPDF